ncbi:MAG: winged helix-turn-helix transcriptional regulator [Flavobacteriales bacterium]|nr:winged helix-turn-helix transcriptional regulator [Flavobacteriales bacterium]
MEQDPSKTLLSARIGAEKLHRASELLRAVAHPQRLAIVDALGIEGRMCNAELQSLLEIEQALLSQHLNLLRDKGLLACAKEGKYSYWTIKHPEFMKVISDLENCCDNL